MSSTPLVRPTLRRRLGRASLTLILIVWTLLVGVCCTQSLLYPLSSNTSPAGFVFLTAVFLAGPLWVLTRRLRFSATSPAPCCLSASFALAASVAVFLAWMASDDETLRHTTIPPALRNDHPAANSGYELTLRYSINVPGSLLSTVPESKLVFPSAELGAENDAKWTDFIVKNSTELDTLWPKLAPLHSWMGELATAPYLGDHTDHTDSPILHFRSMRLISQASCARALLLAAEGRRDEAVETVLPLLAASRNIQPHSNNLVRRMIGLVMQRLAQNTLTRVLATGGISPANRDRLSAALAPAPDAAEQASLLIWCEYPALSNLLLSIDAENATTIFSLPGSENSLLRGLARFAFSVSMNPQLTVNQYGDYLVRSGDAASRRDLATLKTNANEFIEHLAVKFPGKNYGGRMILAMATPAYAKVVENYWKAEDERAALLKRL
ncbi:hypothetical protein IMCC26134_08675 [Verrucomicrobia bacterium IMCC26134]|nr:hypothetical protein IMCC26134_08675 [Verrucomicrobia bacterium IMCC26134]